MINRESSRSFELSRYVPFEDDSDIAGQWQIKIYETNSLVDVLHFEVKDYDTMYFPRFPIFPKRLPGGDPSLITQLNPRGSGGVAIEDVGDAVLLNSSSDREMIWRIPTNKLTRFSYSNMIEGPNSIVFRQNGEQANINMFLWKMSEIVVWFFPPTVVTAVGQASARTGEDSRVEPQIVDLKEDELGFPMMLWCTGLDCATKYAIEVSTDLKEWKTANTITTGEETSAISIESDEPIAFFRISTIAGTE